MKKSKVEQIGIHFGQGKGLYDLLREYESRGCEICLEGEEAEPERIATECLRESVNYMMDFETEDGSDTVSRIDFTRISSAEGGIVPYAEADEEESAVMKGAEESGKLIAARSSRSGQAHSNIATYAGWCR